VPGTAWPERSRSTAVRHKKNQAFFTAGWPKIERILTNFDTKYYKDIVVKPLQLQASQRLQ